MGVGRRTGRLALVAGALSSTLECASFTSAPTNSEATDAGTTADSTEDRPANGDGAAAQPCDPGTPFGSPSVVVTSPTGVNARLSGDELELVFEAGDNSKTPQVWRASRLERTAGFRPGALLVPPIASPGGGADPDVSLDGLTLVFASGRSQSGGWPRDIFLATRGTRAADFGPPGAVTEINSPSFDEAAPYLEPGNAHLWFMRDSKTIWIAPRSGDTFVQPAEVKDLNALGAVGFPVPSDDGMYIYFSLQDQAGSSDVWLAWRTLPGGPFANARPVPELNSPGKDSPNWLSPDGCRIYLTSAPDGGSLQLYVAERSP
jgi:hypothetical protein